MPATEIENSFHWSQQGSRRQSTVLGFAPTRRSFHGRRQGGTPLVASRVSRRVGESSHTKVGTHRRRSGNTLGISRGGGGRRNQEDARRIGFGADLFRFAGDDGAGVFTTNRVAAAPVLLSRQNLVESRGRCRAIVVNSGNANACTGRAGMHTAEETARVAGELLGIEPSQVLVASTGVIGIALNQDLILQQLPH
jgi:hypothetical protein